MSDKLLLICAMSVSVAAIDLSAEEISSNNVEEVRARYEGEWNYPDSSTASNVYGLVRDVYSGHWMPIFDHFVSVRDGGVGRMLSGEHLARFGALSSFVSNHCAEIAANWPTYETNEVVRFTTLSAVGYSGFDNMTNFALSVIGQYSSNTNYCGWNTIKFLRNPYATPMEWYMTMNHEESAISNALATIMAKANERGDTNAVAICEQDLSGEAKVRILELKAAGAL